MILPPAEVPRPRARYRAWPAALLAVLGMVGAGAVAGQAAPRVDPPACEPGSQVRQIQLSSTTHDGWARLAGQNSEEPADPGTGPALCTQLDAGQVDLDPAPAPGV